MTDFDPATHRMVPEQRWFEDFANKTVYLTPEIVELTPSRTTGFVGLASTVHKQRRELLLENTQRNLLKRRSV